MAAPSVSLGRLGCSEVAGGLVDAEFRLADLLVDDVGAGV
jgi:hypothetical protein